MGREANLETTTKGLNQPTNYHHDNFMRSWHYMTVETKKLNITVLMREKYLIIKLHIGTVTRYSKSSQWIGSYLYHLLLNLDLFMACTGIIIFVFFLLLHTCTWMYKHADAKNTKIVHVQLLKGYACIKPCFPVSLEWILILR